MVMSLWPFFGAPCIYTNLKIAQGYINPSHFYPRDATPARIPAIWPCVRTCLSQVGVLSKWMDGIICFGMEASFDQYYTVTTCTVFEGNSGIYRNKGTSIWNFFLNSGFKKFRHHGISTVECAINLARERWRRSERDKLDRRLSTELAIPPSSEARPL